MLITLDVFSGRPNPTWLISQKDTAKLYERFANRALVDAKAVEGVLGYRGIVVSAVGDEMLPDGIPGTFRVGGILPADHALTESKHKALTLDESDDAVHWLLSTGLHAVNEEVLAYVKDAITLRNQGVPTEAPQHAGEQHDEAKLAGLAACIIQNTPYNPAFWNDPAVQPHNNCYNYAMNYRSNTFAQPGRISGHPFAALTCAAVGTAANWDGCTTTCSGGNKNVALVIWPGQDYHWYRRQSQGFWGHKPGSTAARNTDNNGHVINGTTLTPANCARGPYTNFCGYRFSPTGMHVR
jgi:hypothetical protein